MEIFKATGKELAEWLHSEYERISKEVGWKTQEDTQVPFNKLPKKNKRVMLRLAQAIQLKIAEKSILDMAVESL